MAGGGGDTAVLFLATRRQRHREDRARDGVDPSKVINSDQASLHLLQSIQL